MAAHQDRRGGAAHEDVAPAVALRGPQLHGGGHALLQRSHQRQLGGVDQRAIARAAHPKAVHQRSRRDAQVVRPGHTPERQRGRIDAPVARGVADAHAIGNGINGGGERGGLVLGPGARLALGGQQVLALLLRDFLRREVDQHLEVADPHALGIVQPRQRAQREEAPAVTAQHPAVVVGAAVVVGSAHLELGHAGAGVLGREGHPQRLAEPVVFGPAEDAPDALVPAGDAAVPVDHEQGLVAHLHEHRARTQGRLLGCCTVKRKVLHACSRQSTCPVISGGASSGACPGRSACL